MRYTQALEILQQIDGHDSNTAAPFVWRKAWLARRSLLPTALLGLKSPLRKIPGLRYSRLTGLLADGLRKKPVEIATDAHAIQVGKTGNRLRTFLPKNKTTLKVVRETSHYGSATLREIELRSNMAGSNILVPQLMDHERKNGFLFVREQLIEGRSYNIRRDRHLFCTQIIAPLVTFYEHTGITMMPLTDALGPMTAFITKVQADGSIFARLSTLISENPQVAVSLCHNDVLPSNLAVTKNGVYFLDWGSAIPSLCGRDFVRIGERYIRNSAIQEYMKEQISRFHRYKLNLEDMLLVQKLWRSYCGYMGDWRTDTGAYNFKGIT